MNESAVDLPKTQPIALLESRRRALIGWLADGQKSIAEAEASIKQHKAQALEMAAEIEEIEKALNVLSVANKVT